MGRYAEGSAQGLAGGEDLMTESQQFYRTARERIENWTELRANVKGNLELLRRMDADPTPVADDDVTNHIRGLMPKLFRNIPNMFHVKPIHHPLRS